MPAKFTDLICDGKVCVVQRKLLNMFLISLFKPNIIVFEQFKPN